MKKLNQLTGLLAKELSLFLSISFGLFLFVLFFQPFSLDRFDFNNRLIFVAGLGLIVFIIMFLVRVAFPWLFRGSPGTNQSENLPVHFDGFVILVLSSVAFAFYLRFVGKENITFFAMSKVILICFGVSLSLGLSDAISRIRQQNELLIKEKRSLQKQIEKYEEDYLNKTIEFFSENSSEKLDFLIADVALIKSADNYVEIYFREGNNIKKKLIRNTLRNIEHQISQYSNFIRCHRICIVNLHFVDKIENDYTSHWLLLRDFSEQIPVSRQYLLKLKEAL